MNIFAGNSLWQLVWQSDAVSKFVLLLLLGMSVACWAVFLCKLITFRLKNKQFKDVNKQLSGTKNITQLVDITSLHKNSAPGYFLSKNLHFVKDLLQGNLDQTLSEYEWELLEYHVERTCETMYIHNESYLSLISSSAAVAPLLGLFGTVWGLVHSFMRISETQVADITTVAPGIAEALITTLAGLVVAIPALIMFNYLQTHVRLFEHNLITLADRFMFAIQQLRGKVNYAYTPQSTVSQTQQSFN